MQRLKVCFVTFILLLIAGAIQAQFEISAEYRPRFEIRDGYRKLAKEGSVPAVLISQRTRLSFSYKTDNLLIRFTPQDVRIWGDEQLAGSTAVYGDIASLDLFEAYAEIKLSKTWDFSIGRQQLIYDSQRLLSKRNWNQNGIAYDAAILKYHPKKWNLHIGICWNTLTEKLSENHYPSARIKSLNYLWINRALNEKLNLSFIYLASGVTETDTTNTLHMRQTAGIYASYKLNNLISWANVYCQYGKNKYGKNISAFLFDADIAYQARKFKPGIGVGYLSGNNEIGGTTDNLFDVLYGTRHSFFGQMDYFGDFTRDTKQGGLTDIYVYLKYDLTGKMSLTNTLHYFQLSKANPATPQNRNLGFENDLIFDYNFTGWGSLRLGYTFFMPTVNMKELQEISNDKFSQFVYLQLTLKPVLFIHEIK